MPWPIEWPQPWPCTPCAQRWPDASREAPWWSIRTGESISFQRLHRVLKASHLSGSMGRVSSAGDKAAMESFYSLLQKNALNQRRWRTRDDLAYEITYWIDPTYNRRRRQRCLGRLTPVEYERAFGNPAADVA